MLLWWKFFEWGREPTPLSTKGTKLINKAPSVAEREWQSEGLPSIPSTTTPAPCCSSFVCGRWQCCMWVGTGKGLSPAQIPQSYHNSGSNGRPGGSKRKEGWRTWTWTWTETTQASKHPPRGYHLVYPYSSSHTHPYSWADGWADGWYVTGTQTHCVFQWPAADWMNGVPMLKKNLKKHPQAWCHFKDENVVVRMDGWMDDMG